MGTIQYVSGLKQQRCEVDHLRSSNDKVKNDEAMPPLPDVFMA